MLCLLNFTAYTRWPFQIYYFFHGSYSRFKKKNSYANYEFYRPEDLQIKAIKKTWIYDDVILMVRH